MTAIKLKSKKSEMPFEIEHAVKLLKQQEKKGVKEWEIADPNFIFNGNDIIRKSNPKPAEKPKEQE